MWTAGNICKQSRLVIIRKEESSSLWCKGSHTQNGKQDMKGVQCSHYDLHFTKKKLNILYMSTLNNGPTHSINLTAITIPDGLQLAQLRFIAPFRGVVVVGCFRSCFRSQTAFQKEGQENNKYLANDHCKLVCHAECFISMFLFNLHNKPGRQTLLFPVGD